MKMKVASTCLHWSSPVLRHSSQTLASAISSPSFNQLSLTKPDRSNRFNAQPTRLHRSRSCDFPLSSSTKLNFTLIKSFCLSCMINIDHALHADCLWKEHKIDSYGLRFSSAFWKEKRKEKNSQAKIKLKK